MQAAPAEVTPADLSRLRRHFESNEDAVADLTGGLSATQLNWRAEEGRWSILQCVEHLALSDAAYVGAMKPAVEQARAQGSRRGGPIEPSAAGKLFLRKLEPPVASAVRAPKSIAPGVELERDVVLAGFLRVHEQIRALLCDAAELNFNRIKFRNPLFPLLRVRAGTGLLIMAAHERRHLWQARQVRNLLEDAR